MLMSPDSSINPTMSVSQTTTTNQIFSATKIMASPPISVVRVQVQECSQSQPSVAHTAHSAPFSHLAGHLHQPSSAIVGGQQRHHPYHSSSVPTSSSPVNHGPVFFVNKTLGNRGPLPPSTSSSSVQQHNNGPSSASIMLPPSSHEQQQHINAPTVNPTVDGQPMTSTSIKQEVQHQHHHHQQQQHQPQRPETPEYTKSFPVMDTTVASSVKGEPDLNIGMSILKILRILMQKNIAVWSRQYLLFHLCSLECIYD